MKTRGLLTAIAVVELMTGVGLLLAPSTVVELLLGQPLSSGAPLAVGRVAGLALIAIGLICWLENVGDRVGSPTGLLTGLLAYNGAVPVLLVYSDVANRVGGIALWPAVVLHLAFALWIVACIRSSARPRSAP
jgi:hypothetical protein